MIKRLLVLLVLFVSGLQAGTLDPAKMPASGWNGYVGVPGGIPTGQTVWCNVKTSIPGYSGALAVGNGTTDDTAALQFAVQNCPDNQVVYIPAGTYLTASLSRSGANFYDNVNRRFSVIIRGAGPALTEIRMKAGGGIGIYISANGDFSARSMAIVSGNTRGSTSVVLSTLDPYLVVGYPALFRHNNTEAGAVNGGFENGGYMANCTSQVVKVTAINTGTKTVTFTPALNQGYASDAFCISISPPYRCGIEDLKITNTGGSSVHNVLIDGGLECWIKNVESNNAVKWHLRISQSLFTEIRDCYMHDGPDGNGDTIYGTGLYQYTCNSLVENNRCVRTRHAYITEYGGQANVFGYNYSKDPINAYQDTTDYVMGDLTTHGGEPRFNLWEGNVGATIRWDAVLGGSSYNTALRNRVQRKGLPTTYLAGFGSDIQQWNNDNVLMGNVYEAPDPRFTGGLRRWGTDGDTGTLDGGAAQASTTIDGDYQLENNTTQWASSDHSLVTSLYRTSKPSFLGAIPWPSIGPEFTTSNGYNAAYYQVNGGGPNAGTVTVGGNVTVNSLVFP